MLRVLVVDDSAVMRALLCDCLASDPAIEVVGAASDSQSARLMIKTTDPAVLTLDIEMPGMNGLTFLSHLMRLRPMPVVMVASSNGRSAPATLKALELGAVDFAAKPAGDQPECWADFRLDLIAKVKAAAAAVMQGGPARAPAKPRRIVALGGSAGAVAALQQILCALPADAPAILVAVHMPAPFTQHFAQRLDGLCAIHVREAADGAPVLPGHAYVAPGGFHLRLARSGAAYVCRLDSGAKLNGHRPAADSLFQSVAAAAGADAVGVVLTGMGRDGAAGLKAMRSAGALTACQNAASSLIYGMPGAAVAEGAVCDELPLDLIAGYIMAAAGVAGARP